jgi:hypothetical protein
VRSKPISLTDYQLDAILAAAAPLQPYDRSAFLAAIAHYFTGRAEIGELHRAISELQRIYFQPPTLLAVTRKSPRQLEKVGRRAVAAD